MGKTTLGRYAYNYDFQGFYDVKGWCISKDYNRIQAWKGIIESVTSRPFSLTDMGAIQEHVNELLKGKKFFIVIDDLCKISNVEWEAFRAPFLSGKDGSKVIVTTRFPAVARTIGTVEKYLTVRELIDNDECWSLLRSCTGVENDEDSKANIGRNIAKKCSGIPLAIVLVGGILKSKTDTRSWEDVLNSEDLDKTKSVVKMSFDDLPYYLKGCFLFCAMFPEDYEFKEKEVAKLWYGAGLIVSAQQREDVRGLIKEGREDVRGLIKEGRRHFRELVNRSLLMSFGNGYRMPDVIREVGIEMSGNKFCCWDPNIECAERIRHLTLHGRMLHQFVENRKRIDKPLSLRMIMNTDGYNSNIQLQTNDLHVMFSKFKNLRVVLLRFCSISKLPKSVGQMKLLRYLDLSDNPLCKLPIEIGKLTSLRHLNLCSTIEELLPKIGNLTNLSELDLSNYKLEELPSVIGKLTNLFKLDLSYCRELRALPSAIANLTNLTKLYFGECDALKVLPREIGNLSNLSSLVLCGCSDLQLIPGEIGKLTNLLKLDLSRCGDLEVLPPKIGNLINLSELHLAECLSLRRIPSDIGKLTSLCKLDLRGCRKLELLPSEIGNLTNLCCLDLTDCSDLEFIPPGIGNLTNLSCLSFHGCDSLRTLPKAGKLKKVPDPSGVVSEIEGILPIASVLEK